MADALRKRRSESRRRTELVAVRFTPAERARLAEASRCTGKGESTLLREAFLATVGEGVPQVRAGVTVLHHPACTCGGCP